MNITITAEMLKALNDAKPADTIPAFLTGGSIIGFYWKRPAVHEIRDGDRDDQLVIEAVTGDGGGYFALAKLELSTFDTEYSDAQAPFAAIIGSDPENLL
jgi:hypothetical protein